MSVRTIALTLKPTGDERAALERLQRQFNPARPVAAAGTANALTVNLKPPSCAVSVASLPTLTATLP
jgi:hypothetical protein